MDVTGSDAMARITIIQGHPTRGGGHFGHALAAAYSEAALQAGHEVRQIAVAEIEFPLLRDAEEWKTGVPVPAIKAAQVDIAWANHLVFFYPLWLGALPAVFKGFLEQVARPGFAYSFGEGITGMKPLLKGRSARIVVTMGMPATIYRWWFGALTLRSLEQNVLQFVGIRPCRHTVIGMVEGKASARKDWLDHMRVLAARAN
jgi:putative NADPH-quinone reductase